MVFPSHIFLQIWLRYNVDPKNIFRSSDKNSISGLALHYVKLSNGFSVRAKSAGASAPPRAAGALIFQGRGTRSGDPPLRYEDPVSSPRIICHMVPSICSEVVFAAFSQKGASSPRIVLASRSRVHQKLELLSGLPFRTTKYRFAGHWTQRKLNAAQSTN